MKLRRLDDLDDAIDKETAWRKRELTTVLFNVRAAKDSKIQVSLRAGVAMLYAHWEGWIKAVGRLYLQFVNDQSPSYSDLADPFLGAALRTQIDTAASSRRATTHNEFAAFLSGGGLQKRARLSLDLVRAEGNLNSVVLDDILSRLGLPGASYELRANLIDEKLLAQRNIIAHGEHLEVDVASYEDLHANILDMLSCFTTDVLNCAATNQWRRVVPVAAGPP